MKKVFLTILVVATFTSCIDEPSGSWSAVSKQSDCDKARIAALAELNKDESTWSEVFINLSDLDCGIKCSEAQTMIYNSLNSVPGNTATPSQIQESLAAAGLGC